MCRVGYLEYMSVIIEVSKLIRHSVNAELSMRMK